VRTAGVKPATPDGPIVDKSRPGDGPERFVASLLRHVDDVCLGLDSVAAGGSGGRPGTSNDPNILRCTHNFAEGPGYKFTSAAIERRPEHGTLRKEGAFRYVYRPDAGFRGKDAYLVKICATKGDAKGCSTIAYVVTLE